MLLDELSRIMSYHEKNQATKIRWQGKCVIFGKIIYASFRFRILSCDLVCYWCWICSDADVWRLLWMCGVFEGHLALDCAWMCSHWTWSRFATAFIVVFHKLSSNEIDEIDKNIKFIKKTVFSNFKDKIHSLHSFHSVWTADSGTIDTFKTLGIHSKFSFHP